MFCAYFSLNLNQSHSRYTQIANRFLRFSLLALAISLLSACQTYRYTDPWPAELPARKVFIDGYLKKRNKETATEAELAYHLSWIKKFYQGTTLYPNGWLTASERYIASIEDSDDKKKVRQRLHILGKDIANEWAQDNEIRLINSTAIATWASAMRTAAETGQQLSFLDKVEKDVQSLINKTINVRDIKYENYFAEESFDDF